MITRKTKFAVAVATATALAAFAPLVMAQATSTAHLVPGNTLIKVALQTGTKSVFSGTVQGVAVTVSCTASTTSFKTPATGLGPIVTSNPTFTGCTDTLGGKDTIKTNSTAGTWKSTFVAGSGSKPAQLKLTVPKGGATVVSSILPSCTVTVAPTAAATAIATYNNLSTAAFHTVALPTAGTGCTTSATGKLTATYILKPGVKIVP